MLRESSWAALRDLRVRGLDAVCVAPSPDDREPQLARSAAAAIDNAIFRLRIQIVVCAT